MKKPCPVSCMASATDWRASDRNSLIEKVRCYVNPNFKGRNHKSQSKLNLHSQILFNIILISRPRLWPAKMLPLFISWFKITILLAQYNEDRMDAACTPYNIWDR